MRPIILGLAAVVAVAVQIPFGVTAMAYRHRDNGLAYLLLVLGIAVWNGMFAAQLLTPDPTIEVFFLSLTVVGSLLAGLGWFLFASTASRTANVLSGPTAYAVAGVLAGLDVVLAITAPAHTMYWTLPETAPTATSATGFAVVVPRVGFWLHVALLVGLFAAGAALFAGAWVSGLAVGYTRSYALLGLATTVALVGSAVYAPGGWSVAPLVATTLPAVGWAQAGQGRVLDRFHASLDPR